MHLPHLLRAALVAGAIAVPATSNADGDPEAFQGTWTETAWMKQRGLAAVKNDFSLSFTNLFVAQDGRSLYFSANLDTFRFDAKPRGRRKVKILRPAAEVEAFHERVAQELGSSGFPSSVVTRAIVRGAVQLKRDGRDARVKLKIRGKGRTVPQAVDGERPMVYRLKIRYTGTKDVM